MWSSAAVDTDLEMAFIGTGQAYNKPADPKSDSLVAIDYTTGEIVWHQQYTKGDSYTLATGAGPDFDIGAAPNLFEADGRKLVGVGDKGGSYRAFDRETGKVAWVRPLVAGTALGGVEETTAYADGVIYAVGNTAARRRSEHRRAHQGHRVRRRCRHREDQVAHGPRLRAASAASRSPMA